MMASWEAGRAGWNQGTTIEDLPPGACFPVRLDGDISDLNSNGKVALTTQCS